MSTDVREELKSRAREELQRRRSALNAVVETATDDRMKQMELQLQQMQQLVEENARLNNLIHHLIKNQGMSGSLEPAITQRLFGQGIQAAISIPRKHMTDTVCEVPQVSTEMVEWSPSRERRRSKKTPLEAELPIRTPPRPPQGTPQIKKKHRVSASPPTANRYAPLAEETIDDVPDDDMDDATNECLADVEEHLASLKICHRHIQLDSIKKNGASGKE